MQIPSFFEKKKKKRKPIENYYKVLGTRPNAGSDKIKERYVEKLRQFPPETHPKEFQEIRKAYDVLKDPEKRREYDLLRTLGDDLQSLLDEANDCYDRGHFKKAEAILTKILSSVKSIPAFLLLAEIYLIQGDMEQFDACFAGAIAVDPQDEFVILHRKAIILEEQDYDKAVVTLIKSLKKKYPERFHELLPLYMRSLRNMQTISTVWEEIESCLPSIDKQSLEHLEIFLGYVKSLEAAKQWDKKSKVKARMKSYFLLLKEEEDISFVVSCLLDVYHSCMEDLEFRLADFVLELASMLRPKETTYRAMRKEAKEKADQNKLLRRIVNDPKIFPGIQVLALDCFSEKVFGEEARALRARNWKDSFAIFGRYFHLEELEMLEICVAAVWYLKRNYSAVYLAIEKELETLLEEGANSLGLSREERRELKKIRL